MCLEDYEWNRDSFVFDIYLYRPTAQQLMLIIIDVCCLMNEVPLFLCGHPVYSEVRRVFWLFGGYSVVIFMSCVSISWPLNRQCDIIVFIHRISLRFRFIRTLRN